MGPTATRGGLETFIRLYIPKGWVGPIREFDFAPMVSDEDFEMIVRGQIPDKPQYNKWYVKAAIEDWKKQEGI